MSKPRRRSFEERQAIRARNAIIMELSALIGRFDPYGLLFNGVIPSEYFGEAADIVDLLYGCRSADDVQILIYDRFRDKTIPWLAGREEDYVAVGAAVWNWWRVRMSPLQ